MDNYVIDIAKQHHIKEVSALYDDLLDYLNETINYPDWVKHVYPNEKTAQEAFLENSLYTVHIRKLLAAAVILNSNEPDGYSQIQWEIQPSAGTVLVVHTLAVHPQYLKCGIASRVLRFAEALAMQRGVNVIRLDTFVNNVPASKLYEKHKYRFAGLMEQDNKTFRCFEKSVNSANFFNNVLF